MLRAPAVVDSVVLGEENRKSLRQNQNKRSADATADSAEVCWRQNKTKVPKAPPRSKKSASPVSKRGLGRLPSDTEEGASNLIASCEKYLDENPVIINPFIDVKMDQSADIRGSNTSLAQAHRKLSSVSDIRDSIKVTHEDANLSYVAGCQTVPRAFSPRGVSSSPAPSRALRVTTSSPVRTLDRPKPRKTSAVVSNRRPSQGLYKRQDGTESVKSFVIVSNNSTLDLNSDEEDSSAAKNLPGDNFDVSDDCDEWSDDDNSYNKSSDFTNSKNNPRNKGFVNKCVTRVKSLVNPVKN